MNETHILRRQGFVDSEAESSKYSLLFKIIHIGLTIYLFVSLFGIKDVESLKNLSILLNPVVIALILIVISFGKFIVSFNNNTYLEISKSGMRYKNSMHRLFRRFDPEWGFAWKDIKSISFKPKSKSMITDSGHLNLSIELNNGKIFNLLPSAWNEPGNKTSKTKNVKRDFSDLFNYRKWMESLTLGSPLVKLLQSKELLPNEIELKHIKSEWVSITESKIGFGLLILFLGGLIYFAADTAFLLSEFYADTPPYFLFVAMGIVVGALSFILLKKSILKPIEILIMTIMIGVTGALVTYPLLLRVNEWTSDEPLQEYTYTYSSDGIWLSKLPDISSVNINRLSSSYISEFKKGDTYNFELRKGGLGFYQVNMRPMREAQHEFFKKR